MYTFCTYFDQNYLLRGITLYRSLLNCVSSFRLYVLCLDDNSFELLKKLKLDNLLPISIKELESKYPELIIAKNNRKLVEYYFTLTPFLPDYIIGLNPNVDRVTYLDADLFFYSDPSPIFKEMAGNDILITPHCFPLELKSMEKFGLYNVQFITYRNNPNGRACLNLYKKKCAEWCYDYIDGDRFADQKYLDRWPMDFEKVVILNHKGAGLAPWNWMQYDIRLDLKRQFLTVNGEPLIFYHFHLLRIINFNFIDTGVGQYGGVMPSYLREFLYKNYIINLKQSNTFIQKRVTGANFFFSSDVRAQSSHLGKIIDAIHRKSLMIV